MNYARATPQAKKSLPRYGCMFAVQITDQNSVLQSQGMPFAFSSFMYLGPGADYEIDKHVTVPWKNSIPPGNAVIEFEATKV